MRISDWSSDVCSSDLRFSTAEAIMANAAEAYPLVKAAIAARPFDYWTQHLKTMKGQWAAYQSVHDVASDEQVLAHGLIFEVASADGGPRSEGRRIGKAGVRTGRSRWRTDH